MISPSPACGAVRRVWADQGDTGALIPWTAHKHGVRLDVVYPACRQLQRDAPDLATALGYQLGFRGIPTRWRVERTSSWLGHQRRLSTDDEREEQRDQLRQLTKTDRDSRVWRRAQALLAVADGSSLAGTARLFHTWAQRIWMWQTRCAAEGHAGLVDRPHRGRPAKLSAADLAFLAEA